MLQGKQRKCQREQATRLGQPWGQPPRSDERERRQVDQDQEDRERKVNQRHTAPSRLVANPQPLLITCLPPLSSKLIRTMKQPINRNPSVGLVFECNARHFGHDVARALFGFGVDAADVLPQDANAYQLHATEEQDGGHQ